MIDVLKEATSFFESQNIENSRLNAERLLCHVLKIKRIDLYVQFERPLSIQEREDYKMLLRERAKHVPLQYLEGENEFYGIPLSVTSDVLIPRPETEILVEVILKSIDSDTSCHILDIGTGSGAIAIALAKENPNLQITALDISEKALQVAKENAKLNQVEDQINWICDDIFQLKTSLLKFDMIVSNPPYISLVEWDELQPEIKNYEPRIALCDEADGFTFYHFFTKQAQQWLNPDGQIFFEVGYDQDVKVKQMIEENGFRNVKIYPDLQGIGRVVTGRLGG